MRMPPSVISMRVVQRDRTKFRLWLPLFLLWPLLLPLLVLTLLATLLADLVGFLGRQKTGFTRFVVGVMSIVGETRGTEVFVQDRGHADRTVAFLLR